MATFSIILVSVLAFVSLAKTDNIEETGFSKIFNSLHKEPGQPGEQEMGEDKIKELWIEQKLDNFDESETKTWNMRYMANDEFYRIGGPMFIYLGGEWSIAAPSISQGHFYDMAKEHNAYLLHTEHRYYGESIVVPDLTMENLKYLTVRQALADLAHFIRTMKTTITGMENSKVILCGGSYAASIVVWFMKLYPELANGGWASSPLVLAKVDFYEHKEVLGQSIALVGGQACYNRIQNGIAELESMFANKRGAEVKAMLKLCNAFNEYNDLDLWTLFSRILYPITGLVQYHDDGDIQNFCSQIMEGSSDVNAVAKYFADHADIDCSDRSYSAHVIYNSRTENNHSARRWMYQACNEFGWFGTSTSKNQPFGTKFPLKFYIAFCADVFDTKFTNEFIQQQISATNELFGGLTPQVENIYVTQGQLEPNIAMGILDGNQTTIIPNHSHCKDLKSISDNDAVELKAAKEQIAVLVGQWLSE